MMAKENDAEKINVILITMLYLAVQYHYCFMSGTVTALCCLATAYYRDVDYLIIINELS